MLRQIFGIICLVLAGFALTGCERQTQSVSITTFEDCDQGVSKKQVNDLVALLSEFDVVTMEDEQRFYRKLGGPSYPLVSPGCYGINHVDVLSAVIPKRVVSFNVKPFTKGLIQSDVVTYYTQLLNEFSKATHGEWRPLQTQVQFDNGDGQVWINFKAFGESYRWRVDQHEAQDRVGDEFFDSLVKLEVAKLNGMYVDLSKGNTKHFAYLPKKLVPQLRRMGLR